MNNILELWEVALEKLKTEVSNVSFNTWIAPLKPISFVNNTFTIDSPNSFALQTIQNRYLETLQTVLSEACGTTIKVILTAAGANVAPVNNHTTNMTINPHTKLNPKYTFDTFIVGNGNSFVHAGALAVAELPGQSYNPLFIYGGPGLGKTHLMHAIGNFVLENNPSANVMYVTSETFTNELIYAIQRSNNEQFREKYRNVDVLLIDDIQFIGGKERTNEEFFHTFNALYEGAKQIVISSDKPPKEIAGLEERLRSRFEWGLIADIQRPDYETRVAILRKKAESDNILVEPEVLEYIADIVQSNIRELEGSLSRVQAYCKLHNSDINLESTIEALKGTYGVQKPKIITPLNIKDIVCEYYGISLDDIDSHKRNRAIAVPRQIAMYIVRTMTDMSYPQIGETFGGKDHTTVLHAVKKVEAEYKTNPNLKSIIDDMIQSIK